MTSLTLSIDPTTTTSMDADANSVKCPWCGIIGDRLGAGDDKPGSATCMVCEQPMIVWHEWTLTHRAARPKGGSE